MSIIESIINGLIGGVMIWVTIIVLLVLWVFFGDLVKIGILIIMVYYFCKNLCRLFEILGSTGKKILVVTTVLFLAFCTPNIMNIPMWIGASLILALFYHIKKPAP